MGFLDPDQHQFLLDLLPPQPVLSTPQIQYSEGEVHFGKALYAIGSQDTVHLYGIDPKDWQTVWIPLVFLIHCQHILYIRLECSWSYVHSNITGNYVTAAGECWLTWFILSWVYFPLSWTGPTELKTLTLSAGMYMLIYSFPLTQRQGCTGRHSLGIDTPTTGRKGENKGLSWKEVLWRKREDSVTIKNK